jgi:hypothetical protein
MIIRPVSSFPMASTYGVTMTLVQTAPTTSAATVTRFKDVVIYRDDTFQSAFPSIVRRDDGALLIAFRRAPDPRNFGDRGVTRLAQVQRVAGGRKEDTTLEARLPARCWSLHLPRCRPCIG